MQNVGRTKSGSEMKLNVRAFSSDTGGRLSGDEVGRFIIQAAQDSALESVSGSALVEKLKASPADDKAQRISNTSRVSGPPRTTCRRIASKTVGSGVRPHLNFLRSSKY